MVLNHAIAQRPYQINVRRGTPHHAQRVFADGQNGIAAGIHRADGRLAEHYALLFCCNDDGGCPQINADILLIHLLFSVEVRFSLGNSSVAATAATVTSTAPAFSSSSAQAEAVAPVVMMSSTSKTCLPLRSAPGRQR